MTGQIYWIDKRIKSEELGVPLPNNSYDIDEIKSRVTAQSVIGHKPKHESQGKEFYCCPIHNEKTPSFVWNKQEKYYHCFGACSSGGDVIDLYMKINGCDFRTALKELQYL